VEEQNIEPYQRIVSAFSVYMIHREPEDAGTGVHFAVQYPPPLLGLALSELLHTWLYKLSREYFPEYKR